MSKDNHSRFYYVSNQNMSDIKQSIDQQSMTLDKQSGLHINSKSKSSIPQIISGSHQNYQNKNIYKNKSNLNNNRINVQEFEKQQNQNCQPVVQGYDKKPQYLGEQVFIIIKERYYQTNKISTDDKQVLYDFYISQRKQRSLIKQIKDQQIQKQMPSMQKKLITRKQFHKILSYYPEDVYYTLCRQEEKIKLDKTIQQKTQYINKSVQNQLKKKQKPRKINKTSENLYNPKSKVPKKQIQITQQQKQKIKRNAFGKNLSQYFQKNNKQKGQPYNIQTIEKLYQFWQDCYQRQQYGIQWEQDNVKITIQQYMYQQIQDLIIYADQKLGFKCGKANSLFMIYSTNYPKIKNIYIPINSYEQYVKIYNEVEHRKMQQNLARTRSQQIKKQQQKKLNQTKKFGRPVSATPISILAKPKTKLSQLQQLANKYPDDKLLKNLLTQEQLKLPRYPFQYGIYNIEDEVKTKQWVKINPKLKDVRYQDQINQKLINTYSNPQFSVNQHHQDQVISLLSEQNIQKDETWKQLGPILHEAMLVKAYNEPWFLQCILKYLQRSTGQKNNLQTNQVIFKKLFFFLNNINQDKKVNQFDKIKSLISISEKIQENTKKIQSLPKQGSQKNNNRKQKKLFNFILEEKAIQYVKMRIRKTNQKFILRNYLKQLYQECMKQHKQYITKNFNVVEGDKQCPKLLKYQFFRMVKQINPITLSRQKNLKNHAWLPPKQTPQNFNYKTYNLFAQFYTKDHNIIIAQPQLPVMEKSLWGRKKGKDRENLMMTYQDAHQCTFQPKISSKIN